MRSEHEGGSTVSIWHDTSDIRRFDTTPELEADVVIVGAGIAGLTTAYELVKQGARVVVLDDGPIGGGESGRTSAHLASAVDDHFHMLEDKFGERGAKLVAESHSAAIDYIERTAGELGIDCDFQRVPGFLFSPPGKGYDQSLDKELAAARRAGLIVDKVDRAPLPFDTGPALRFERQAEFHPLKYLRGLADAIVAAGGKIHTGVHVEMIEPGEPLTIRLAGGRRMVCQIAVDATNSTITSPVKLTIRQAAYRTYILGFEIPPGSVPHGLYWDTLDIYHYIRVVRADDGREVLIVGGEDHRTGQGDPNAAWAELEAWTRKWFPNAGAIVYQWSGQVLEPVDGNAHIGASPDLDHVYVCTGDSGNGLTHGTIAGILLPQLMRGHHHRWTEVYDPKRSKFHALGTFVKEASQSSWPYTDWLKRGDVSSEDHIPPGQGALVRHGLHFVAAYRDEAGVLHKCSATCTHLRGVVQWNSAEKTWDCPCHGSRFDPYGRVVNGPAPSDLKSLDEKPEQPREEPVRETPAGAPPGPELRR
ncbi:MAG TPA: FAD-dependent oxidoreductase [Kofleriaceae bacterium]|nr:FAD-dependent oxidoreductase [Kofleriaceae bacterium]